MVGKSKKLVVNQPARNFLPRLLYKSLSVCRWTINVHIIASEPRLNHGIFTKTYIAHLFHPEGRDEQQRKAKCQTVWPFLGHIAATSVWEINLLSSLDRNLTLTCLHRHPLPLFIPTLTSSSPARVFLHLVSPRPYLPTRPNIYKMSISLPLFSFTLSLCLQRIHYPRPGNLSFICVPPSVSLAHSSAH